jgi:multidrug efflux pump subunit AcrB
MRSANSACRHRRSRHRFRACVNGDTATYWTKPSGDQVEVTLRMNQSQRERLEQLRTLPVAFAKDGTPISLDSVATIESVFNPEVIRRQNLQRREAVFAGVKDRSVGEVGDDVQKLIKDTVLPPGYSFDVGGQLQQQEAFGGLLAAMGLAVIVIYIVLASQFGSFIQPIAIMASLPLALALVLPLPLALIGVMLALLLWRGTLNVFSMIGLVMLMGLVTKNAIRLVDFANELT